MKAYLATSFKNKEDFQVLRQFLEINGHSVTHDWTEDTTEGVLKEDLPAYLMSCAGLCLLGVQAADVFILIARPNMAGAFVEMGFALACSIPVVVLDAHEPGNQTNIFYHLPNCSAFQHVKSYEELLTIMGGPPKPTNPYDDVVKLRPDFPGNN